MELVVYVLVLKSFSEAFGWNQSSQSPCIYYPSQILIKEFGANHRMTKLLPDFKYFILTIFTIL